MFVQKVARLNGNILALCYSQNVLPTQLSATHTVSNIQQLLAAEDLGRTGAVDVANSKIIDVMQLNAEIVDDESDSEGRSEGFVWCEHEKYEFNDDEFYAFGKI